VLRRKVRVNAGRQYAISDVRQAVLAQYAAHKSWSVQAGTADPGTISVVDLPRPRPAKFAGLRSRRTLQSGPNAAKVENSPKVLVRGVYWNFLAVIRLNFDADLVAFELGDHEDEFEVWIDGLYSNVFRAERELRLAGPQS
jgi:hypothetical protein